MNQAKAQEKEAKAQAKAQEKEAKAQAKAQEKDAKAKAKAQEKEAKAQAKAEAGMLRVRFNHSDPTSAFAIDHCIEIGVDEAGRGPLFGRVYTGAVVLPLPSSSSSVIFNYSLLKDSKKFTSVQKIREVSDYIKQHALAWAVKYEEHDVIDSINIRQATIRCMHAAIRDVMAQMGASAANTLLLIDGNDFIPMSTFNKQHGTLMQTPHVCVEGGDNTYCAIAAASILAKVARDTYIEELCDKYPELDTMYGIRGNKGYGAKRHLEGIKEHGITQWHRRSYSTNVGAPVNVLV